MRKRRAVRHFQHRGKASMASTQPPEGDFQELSYPSGFNGIVTSAPICRNQRKSLHSSEDQSAARDKPHTLLKGRASLVAFHASSDRAH